MTTRVCSRFPWRTILLLITLIQGCTSTNPAAPPSPLAEIPSFLVFPESVGTDLSQISGEGGGGAIRSDFKFQMVDNFLDAILIGGQTIAGLNGNVEGLLQNFRNLRIPVNTSVQTIEIKEEVSDSIPRTFKIHFGDYDYNGDGKTEGCSGCSCPADCSLPNCPSELPFSDLMPVCYRIWVQDLPAGPFKQNIAGVFDILPTEDASETAENEDNAGKGRFRSGFTSSTTFGSGTGEATSVETHSFGVVFDHKDPLQPLNKSTEGFLIQRIVDSEGTLVLSNNIHSQATDVERIDPSDKSYLEKTARVHLENFQKAGTEGLPEDIHPLLEYVGRFRDDENFWSGSALALFPEGNFTVPTTCARILDGVGPLPDICQDLGIDTSGEDVTKGQTIRKSEDSDVNFPADFPLLPTF